MKQLMLTAVTAMAAVGVRGQFLSVPPTPDYEYARRQAIIGLGSNVSVTPVAESRNLSYIVANSSGSDIEDIYIKPAGEDDWSSTCLPSTSVVRQFNTSGIMIQKSDQNHGSVKVITARGEWEAWPRDGFKYNALKERTVACVPVGGYDGEAYRMKVRWADGEERVFYLPYPWGDVTIYRERVYANLGISGRGIFYHSSIEAE